MKYAVVAHDAGGAELLSSYVRQHSLYSHFVLEGPAIAIFERKLGPLQLVDLQWAIANSDELICSTSWQSDLEVNAISQAKSAHKKSVAILDHWLNYKERFERNGITTRPNQILVCDETANKLAIDFFPDIEITQVDNPYLLDVAVEFRQYYNDNPILAKRGCRVLYLGENISDHAMARYGDSMYFGYSEETALSYFIKNIDKLNLGITEIAVRPHPSEKGDKYLRQLCKLPYEILTNTRNTLIQDIIEADVIVGCSSMALVIATLANKMVVSCIPPGAALPPWPYKNIVELRNL